MQKQCDINVKLQTAEPPLSQRTCTKQNDWGKRWKVSVSEKRPCAELSRFPLPQPFNSHKKWPLTEPVNDFPNVATSICKAEIGCERVSTP